MQETRYTTRQVAKICQVNIATVINWIDKGGLKAFKTYGGHRRVQQKDLIPFMKKLGFPIPKELISEAYNKVLVVDDDPKVLKSITASLKRNHKICQFYTAESGFEAGWKTRHIKPDIVILDIRMPGIDGFKVCDMIREKDKDVKIIAITGYPSEAARKKILSKGANVYLKKPLNIEKLIKIMIDLCDMENCVYAKASNK